MNYIRTALPRLVVAGVLALSLASGARVALAASGPAFVGACNMLNAWDVGANGGMAHAMSVDNSPKGNGTPGQSGGMWGAVLASGGGVCA